jgi:hypothetical protein
MTVVVGGVAFAGCGDPLCLDADDAWLRVGDAGHHLSARLLPYISTLNKKK